MTRRRVPRATALWVGFWVLAFIATHVPPPRQALPPPPWTDKVIHFAMFATLSFLGGRRWFLGASHVPDDFSADDPERSAATLTFRDRLPVWVGIYVAYAAFDELTQPFMRRTAEWGDFLADLLGITLGTWAVHRRYARLRQETAVRPASRQL